MSTISSALGPSAAQVGGSALQTFLNTAQADAQKLLKKNGTVAGLSENFTSANGDIVVSVGSQQITDSNGKTTYGITYNLKSFSGGSQIAVTDGITDPINSSDDIKNGFSTIGGATSDQPTTIPFKTNDEYLEYVKQKYPQDYTQISSVIHAADAGAMADTALPGATLSDGSSSRTPESTTTGSGSALNSASSNPAAQLAAAVEKLHEASKPSHTSTFISSTSTSVDIAKSLYQSVNIKA